MGYRLEQTKDGESIVIDGWENGIASSPYLGTGNIRNLSTSYYPGVAYTNYKRLAATIVHTITLTGALSANAVSATLSTNWLYTTGAYTMLFSNGDSRSATLTKGATTMTWTGGLTGSATTSVGVSMSNPVQKAVSPLGLIYIQDESGRIWKQSAVHSSTFNILEGSGRITNGAGGIAYWNNYLWVFGNEMIEVCGDGSGDAGITSSYWNYNGGSGFAFNPFEITTNFAGNQEGVHISNVKYSTPKLYVGSPVTFTSTGTLPAPLVAGTTYYLAYNYGASTSGGISATWALSTSVENIYQRVNITKILSGATSATLTNAWTGTTGVYTVYFNPYGVALGTGGFDSKAVTFTNGATTMTWTGALGADYDPQFVVLVTYTNNGTGTHSMSVNNSGLPLGNSTQVDFGQFAATYPALTGSWNYDSQYYIKIGSSVNPVGTTIKGVWQGATGIYNMIMATGEKAPMSIVNASNSFSFLSGFTYKGYGSNWKLQLLDPTVTNYRPYVSKVDGSLMFCNGQFIGRISLNSDPNVKFNPSLPSTYYVSFGVTSIPEQFTDTVTDMTDLRSSLVVAGKKDTYTWDYVSASCSSPAPVGEEIKGLVNILSNVYVLAGEKGNIYGSNGYSNQLLYKLPDFIAGIIDPVWQWGDVMVHRSRLFFQATAKEPN